MSAELLVTVEARIRAAVPAARARGWSIVEGQCCDPDEKECCAGYAVVIADDGKTDGDMEEMAYALGLTSDQAAALANGFDDWTTTAQAKRVMASEPEWFALGRRLREEFLS